MDLSLLCVQTTMQCSPVLATKEYILHETYVCMAARYKSLYSRGILDSNETHEYIQNVVIQ